MIKVNSDSPGDKSEIKLGDIIEEVNGTKVTNNEDFLRCLGYKLNQAYNLKVNSNGKIKNV